MKEFITIKGAREHNLQNVDVSVPLCTLTCVTGVSGSGKSSLINEILYKSLAKQLNRARTLAGKHDSIIGVEQLDKVIDIDQSPIGRTPRSNPATYTGVFDLIRDLFASTQDAKMKGYSKGRFSFNVKGGRCEACGGNGYKTIETLLGRVVLLFPIVREGYLDAATGAYITHIACDVAATGYAALRKYQRANVVVGIYYGIKHPHL